MNRVLPRSYIRALLWLCALLAPAMAVATDSNRSWTSLRWEFRDLKRSALVPATLEYSELRWALGDDVRRAQPDWDDAGWQQSFNRQIPSHTGIFWLRFRVRDLTRALPAAIYLQGTHAYDLYWDGVLIGRSGVPGNRWADEVPGSIDNLFTLPEILCAKGEHVVAMRMSNFRNGFPAPTMPFNFAILPGGALQDFNRESAILPILGVGAMLTAMMTSVVMWLVAARRPVLLLFAAVCGWAAIMQALLMLRFTYGYTYDWLYPALVATQVSLNAFGFCLVALVIVQCKLPHWCWLLMPVTLLVGWALGWFLVTGSNHAVTAFLTSSVLGGAWAMVRRHRGAELVFGGVLLTTVMWLHDARHFANGFFLQDFLPTMLGLTSAVALDIRDERRKARETQLMAARLEIELLKKNLQPHFMLNTLTALTEVIEKDPPGAVKLINDLAEEFRALARIAGEKQVPLGQELELCRAHLRVISVRTGSTWKLETAGIDETAAIPPALFLTLIENGFIHQEPSGTSSTFSLQATRMAGLVRYTFLSPGEIRVTRDRVEGGTGLKYVRARLEESFPGRWHLVSGAVANGWQTVIELAQPRAKPASL